MASEKVTMDGSGATVELVAGHKHDEEEEGLRT